MKNWTEKQLIQYFRQKFQTRVLLEVICLICISMILFAGITQSWWWPYLVILGITEIFLAILVLLDLKNLVDHPEKIITKAKLFRRYGNPSQVAKMLEIMSQNLIYNDNMLSISNECLMIDDQPETLTHIDDLLIIWPSTIYQANNSTQNEAEIAGFRLTWYDIYGEKFQVQYGNNAKSKIKSIINLIQQQFPWVKVGKPSFLGEFLHDKTRPLPKLEYRTELEHLNRQVSNITEAKVVKRRSHSRKK